MRWEDGRESSNVDDDRGESDGGGGGGGFGLGGGGLGGLLMLLPLLGRGGGGVLALVVIGLLVFGGPLLRGMGGGGQAPPQRAPSGYTGAGGQAGAQSGRTTDPSLRFVKVIAGYTEDTWSRVFQDMGRTYTAPRFTIYTRGHKTACGYGQTEMGPFYCPGDQRVYLDLAFFQELSGRFGAPGDFAKAYVVAHEVGHHVQHLLGTLGDDGARASHAGDTRNEASVRTELQADCYAGVWAAQTNHLHGDRIMEPGDLESGLKAASAVGDDTLQRASRGTVAPDSFTHGTAAQRTHWLRAGYDAGDIKACDTFGPSYDAL